MEKSKFFEPEVDVITFDERDVITLSEGTGFGADDAGGGEEQTWAF